MKLSQCQNLFNQVKGVIEKYKKINELTGDNFNVFRILKLESSEVRMHSAFLAELLNPHGSHGQKDAFLKLFIHAFCFKGNDIDTMSCRVKVEESIGTIAKDFTQGGRIDVVIRDKFFNQIVIENKIYAGDQNNQLIRYHNYSGKADLIYLTLDGKVPSDDSRGLLQADTDFKCYSYKNDIISWLELCRKEVAVFPLVREGITHYINLIKYLTGQTINKNMQEELDDLIKANIEASFAIANNLDSACDKLSAEFGERLEDAINQFDNSLFCKYGVSFKKNYSGIWIMKPEWKFINIGFQFQSTDRNLIYGIVTKENPAKAPIPLELKNKIKLLPNNTPKSNDWWPWFQYIEEPYNNWNKYQAWQAVIDGRMQDLIVDKVKHLLELTAEIDL